MWHLDLASRDREVEVLLCGLAQLIELPVHDHVLLLVELQRALSLASIFRALLPAGFDRLVEVVFDAVPDLLDHRTPRDRSVLAVHAI